jgi:hypothetical protein
MVLRVCRHRLSQTIAEMNKHTNHSYLNAARLPVPPRPLQQCQFLMDSNPMLPQCKGGVLPSQSSPLICGGAWNNDASPVNQPARSSTASATRSAARYSSLSIFAVAQTSIAPRRPSWSFASTTGLLIVPRVVRLTMLGICSYYVLIVK